MPAFATNVRSVRGVVAAGCARLAAAVPIAAAVPVFAAALAAIRAGIRAGTFAACRSWRRAATLGALLAAWALLPAAPLALADAPKPAAKQAAAAAPAEAPRERRLALVVGNARYSTAPLNNPENDARVIGSTLRRLGFEVAEHVNLPARDLRRVLRDFARRVQHEDGVALFYYAGHGVQIEGRNYLLPVDFSARDEDEAKDSGVDIDDIFVSRLERAKAPVRIVILDACRDNPFETRTAGRSRSVRGSGGLAEMGGRGALIAYASAPGATAEDGPPGTNSVYTRHLAAEMLVEGVEVEQMFKNVRVKVLRDTQQRQIPWVNTSLTANFSFNPRSGAPAGGADDVGRRDELARLQALLEQRDREQRRLEAQLRQLRESADGASVASGADRPATANGTAGPSGPTAAPVPAAPVAGSSADTPPGPGALANASPGLAGAAPNSALPAPGAGAGAPAVVGNPAGGTPSPAAGSQRPAAVAQAPPRKPESAPAPARSRPGALSEQCAALLIRAQLGEALSAADMAHLQKECR